MTTDPKIFQQVAKDFSLLYVEDDDIVREKTARLLSNFFPGIATASNGKEALSMVEKQHFDILVTDIEMPRMTGVELSRALKQKEDCPKIIVISAHNEAMHLLELVNIGVDYFVSKPIDVRNLLLSLEKVIFPLRNQKIATMARETESLNKAVKVAKDLAHHWRQPLTALSLGIEELVDLYEDGDLTLPLLKSKVKEFVILIQGMSRKISEVYILSEKDLKEMEKLNEEILKISLEGGKKGIVIFQN